MESNTIVLKENAKYYRRASCWLWSLFTFFSLIVACRPTKTQYRLIAIVSFVSEQIYLYYIEYMNCCRCRRT